MKLQFFIMVLVLVSSTYALQITDAGPQGYINTNEIEFFANTDNTSTCTIEIGTTIHNMTGLLQHTFTKIMVEGEHTVNFECTDNNETDTEQATIVVDTSAPTITLTDFPDEIVNQPRQIQIETSESSDCKYSESITNYNDMEHGFQKITSKKHFINIDNKPQANYLYNMACKDNSGLVTNEIKEFYVNLKPTAQVSFGDDPLTEGTYEITVVTSEVMANIPRLYYFFNDDGTLRPIALTGEGTIFKGFMIITENQGEKIGTFSFVGKDSSNLRGEEITTGKIFLVDTIAPEAPDSLELTADEDNVYLEWNYEDEYDEFIIYRSKNPNVEKTDKYKTTSKKSYTDKNVEEGVTYFYRIATEDEAGNIGELSQEEEIFVIENDDKELSPILQFKLQAAIDIFEQEVFDYEASKRELQDKSNTEIAKIDSSLKVSQGITDAITKLNRIVTELNNLKNVDLTESALASRISNYDKQLREIRTTVYHDIRIVDQRTVNLQSDTAGVNTAITEYLLGTEIDEEDLDNYTNSMNGMQSGITVTAEAIIATLISKNSEKSITYIQKDITTNTPIKKSSIIEIIPKDLARSASDITFSNNPIVLQNDPILQWDLAELTSQTITYWVEEQKNTNLLSLTKTVILTRPTLKDNLPEITGNVASEPNSGGGGWQVFSIISLGVVIGGLLVYYFIISKKPVTKTNEFAGKKFHYVIHAAHQAIDNLQKEKAAQLYTDAYKLYLAMSEKEQTQQYNSLTSMYNKLLLAKNIERAHNFVDSKQLDQLPKISSYINNMKNYASINTTLWDYADSTIKYFAELTA